MSFGGAAGNAFVIALVWAGVRAIRGRGAWNEGGVRGMTEGAWYEECVK